MTSSVEFRTRTKHPAYAQVQCIINALNEFERSFRNWISKCVSNHGLCKQKHFHFKNRNKARDLSKFKKHVILIKEKFSNNVLWSLDSDWLIFCTCNLLFLFLGTRHLSHFSIEYPQTRQ